MCAIPAMGGELDGVRYLSRRMIEQATTEQAYGECPLLGWTKFGLGFGLNSERWPYPSPTTFGWGGKGGSWALMDPKAAVSFGYAPNNFIVAPVDPRLSRFSLALHELLPTL
jgi:CubicO group peptidase (beta-lactamase class C family)